MYLLYTVQISRDLLFRPEVRNFETDVHLSEKHHLQNCQKSQKFIWHPNEILAGLSRQFLL